MVRLLADESCDFAVVRSLRGAGFDVVSAAEATPGAPDDSVIDVAARDGRVVLTEDKDFGQLMHASGGSRVGVVLIRFPGTARKALADAVLQLVRQRGERLTGSFAVVQPGRVRITRPPQN